MTRYRLTEQGADQIRFLYQKNGLRQCDLAKRLGIASSSLSAKMTAVNSFTQYELTTMYEEIFKRDEDAQFLADPTNPVYSEYYDERSPSEISASKPPRTKGEEARLLGDIGSVVTGMVGRTFAAAEEADRGEDYLAELFTTLGDLKRKYVPKD